MEGNMWQSWINIAAGIWAIISGLVTTLVAPLNFFITGLVIAVFGFWTPDRKWQGIVNGILGLWFILSAFVPSLVTPANMLIVGVVVLVLASWRAAESRAPQARTARTAPPSSAAPSTR
jgi:hypothetical protein